VSGEGSPVEVLRIRNPEPGRWRVRLRSEADTPQNVSAVVIWKSAVRSSVFVDPPAPAPGQVITVTVTGETRKAAGTDPRAPALPGVGAGLTGAGFAQEVKTPLADDGKAPDEAAGDGRFSGQLTVPTTATGALHLVGVVAGEGIVGDQRPWDGQVGQPGTQPSRHIRRAARQVPPGGVLAGTLLVTNDSGRERRGRLVITSLAEGVQVTVAPVLYDLPASGRQSYPFELAVDPGSARGVSF